MKLQLHDISDGEFQIVHEAVLRLLSEYGVLFEDEAARAMLIKAGNRGDDEGRVHLGPKFVETMLEMVPREGFVLYGRDESKTMQAAVDEIGFRPSVGAPFIFDYSTRCRRQATAEDAKAMITLTDALDGYDMVHSVVTPEDAPGTIANVLLFADSHRYSLNPSDVTVIHDREVIAIAKVAAAIRGGERRLREKPLTAVDVAMITPLRCTKEQAAALIDLAHGRAEETVEPHSVEPFDAEIEKRINRILDETRF